MKTAPPVFRSAKRTVGPFWSDVMRVATKAALSPRCDRAACGRPPRAGGLAPRPEPPDSANRIEPRLGAWTLHSPSGGSRFRPAVRLLKHTSYPEACTFHRRPQSDFTAA